MAERGMLPMALRGRRPWGPPVSSHPRAQPHIRKHVLQGLKESTLRHTCLCRARLPHRKNTDGCLLKVTAEPPRSPPPEAGPAFSLDQLRGWRLGPSRGLLFSRDGAPVPRLSALPRFLTPVFRRPSTPAVTLYQLPW